MVVSSSLYKEAVERFGKENQLLVTIGELSELSSELAKALIPQHKTPEEELLLEIADVCIMMEQLKVIYGEDNINRAIELKLKKVAKHVYGRS